MKIKVERDHYKDIQLLSGFSVTFGYTIVIIFLILFPFCFNDFHIFMANYMAVNIIVAVGLNFLVGYAGQISIGHAGFFAIGAYGTIILMGKLYLPFFLALPLAAFISAFFGFLLGLPCLRLKGPYLAIATLGFALTVTQIIGRSNFFGGRTGLNSPKLVIANYHINSDRDFYFIIIPIALLLIWMARNVVKTKVGRAWGAIRDSEIAAETMGINLAFYKTLVFAWSAFYTGMAGGLYVFVLRIIEPEIFTLNKSIMFLSMVIIGGVGSIMGSVLGACLISLLDFELRNIFNIPYLGSFLESLSQKYFSMAGASSIQFVIFGGIMVFIMLYWPLGMYGIWLKIKSEGEYYIDKFLLFIYRLLP